MRCWDCKALVVVPERDLTLRPPLPQVHSVDISCTCGANYRVTIARLPKRANRPASDLSEDQWRQT